MKPTERDVEMAKEWLMDRANPEDEGGMGMFVDTRFGDDLATLIAQAREEGRLLGLEQAAVYCETHAYIDHETARPDNIRALKGESWDRRDMERKPRSPTSSTRTAKVKGPVHQLLEPAVGRYGAVPTVSRQTQQGSRTRQGGVVTKKDFERLERKINIILRICMFGANASFPSGTALKHRAIHLTRCGLTPKEIAEIIGTTPNTVSVALSQAKKELGKGES